jgi:hypothetical protein
MRVIIDISINAPHHHFMRHNLTDTPPEIEKLIVEGYRKMSAAQKLRIMQDLIRTAHLLALSDIKRRHPNAVERELQLRLASRWLEPELMRKAFGWDHEVEGY